MKSHTRDVEGSETQRYQCYHGFSSFKLQWISKKKEEGPFGVDEKLIVAEDSKGVVVINIRNNHHYPVDDLDWILNSLDRYHLSPLESNTQEFKDMFEDEIARNFLERFTQT